MNIPIVIERPSLHELADAVNAEFGDRYSCEVLSMGKAKSLFVKKSAFVAMQIKIAEEENIICIEGTMKPTGFPLIAWMINLLLGGGNLVNGKLFRPQR